MSRSMRAVQFDSYGPPSVLHVGPAPVPRLEPGHVVVKVYATSVNGADVLVRSGALRLLSGRRFPRGTGYDFTGEITAVAHDVTTHAEGDQVWGFDNWTKVGGLNGTTAEFVVVPVEKVAAVPRGIDVVEAAALPGAGGAALGALQVLGVRPGERVLIRGANGGVGVSAVQIAHSMGAVVTAVARAQHTERLARLGATHTVDRHQTRPQDFGTFDVILDTVSRDIRPYEHLLSTNGRIGVMALGRPRDLAYSVAKGVLPPRKIRRIQTLPHQRLLRELAGLTEAGKVQPVVDGVYALDDVAAAHASIERGGGFGKRVVVSSG